MDANEIKNALDEIFDQAVLFHAFTDYMRDYEVIAYVSTDPQSGIAPKTLSFLFKYCVEAHVETAVRPDGWKSSLSDALLDRKTGPDHDGYVWGIRWQNLYPGASLLPESVAASKQEREIGIGFHEVKFETNGHNLTLVFSDLEVREVKPGYSPFEVPEDYVVVVDFRPVEDADRAFGYWLKHRGLARDELEPEDFYVDTGRGAGGSTIRSYRVLSSIASTARVAPFGAPPPPSRDDVEERLRQLIMGRASRKDVAAWAMRWIGAGDPGVEDRNVWDALTALGAADMPTTDREWLYEREDSEGWLRDLRSNEQAVVEERVLDGRSIRTPDEFYEAFFATIGTLVPDYGGRNLDALNDDLRELSEPLTIVWTYAGESSRALGEWFGHCLSVLLEREMGAPVTVLLRPGSQSPSRPRRRSS